MHKLLLLMCLSALTSCVIYTNPKRDPNTTAEIKNTSRREGLLTWEHFTIEQVGDLWVSYDLSWTPTTKTIRLKKGPQKLVVLGEFNRKGSGPQCARSTLHPVIKEGRTYRVTGRIGESEIQFWVEDATTGEKASAVTTEVFGVSPIPPFPIYVPVVH